MNEQVKAEFDVSNVKAMREKTLKIRSMVNADLLNVNSALHEKLVLYVSQHELSERSLLNAVSDKLIRLNTAAWQDFELEIERIRKDSALAADERVEVEQVFRRSIEDKAQRETQALDALLADQRAVLGELTRFTVDAADIEASLVREVEKYALSLARAREAIAAQVARKAELDTLVETFGQAGLSKVFKGMIPTAEQIDAAEQILSTKGLDTSALKEISRTLERNIDVLHEGRDYSNAAAARERVRIDLEEREEDLRKVEQISRNKQRELDQTRQLPAFDSLRQQWMTEAAKIPAGLALLMASFKQRLTAESACEGLLEVAAYLRAIRSRIDGN